MTSYSLIIKNGRILTPLGIIDSDISLDDGKIAAIGNSSRSESSRTIDAQAKLILPGLIDPHVHFRDPGLTQKEDFLSGSKGAVAGGVTTVFDMPTTQPVVTSVSRFNEKIEIVKPKALSNFGLIAAAGEENLSDIPSLASAGAIAFKTYMVSPPKGRTKEYEGSFISNSGQLYRVMEQVGKTGLIHCIHAESDSTISCLTERLVAQGRKDPMAHYDSRPNFTEAEAVYDAILLSKVLHTRLHLVHISTSEATQLIREAKLDHSDVSAETCPHDLCFTRELLKTRGPYAKYNPPSRNLGDTKALYDALNDGTIDMVATDHAPHTKEEKEGGREDIFRAPPGTPGVETRLPILLRMAHDGLLRLEDIPKLTSESVAQRFGVQSKGSIQVGFDADLVIVDYDSEWTVKASELQTKAWETVLYDGMKVRGKVKYTILNGEVAYEEGVGFAKPGIGKMVKGRMGINN
ncbi:MAG: dihydroorotase [Nitrososphaerales archaeon]